MTSQNKIVQEIQDLDLVKNVKKEISKLSDQFINSYDKLSGKKRSMVGIGWILGAGVVLGAIYLMNRDRNVKKLKHINDKNSS